MINNNIIIRKFNNYDREDVRRISCDTAFSEGSRKYFFDDGEILADLKTNISGSFLTSDRQFDLSVFPEQLNIEEITSFVGIEERSVSIEDKDIVFFIKLSRPFLKTTIGVSVFIFGYRQDRPFKDMPKLHLKFGSIEHQVLNQGKILSLDSIKVERNPKEIKIRVPLDLLGNPQYILTSANTYLGTVPLDWILWRTLKITY